MEPTALYVSTGVLPPHERVRGLVHEAFDRYRVVTEGRVSDVYPALARASPDAFAISVVSTGGDVVDVGDTHLEFTIMSVSKPFVFALVCATRGPDHVRDLVGVNATGLPFNSLDAVERTADGRTNPMVNPGAIATTSLAPGATTEERWSFLVDGLSSFAGRALALQEDVYQSASETNHVNRAIANLLEARARISGNPMEALELYTRQSSLSVTAHDLAVMGATLADGGVNPVTRERVVDEETCRRTLAVMTTAGLYEMSGDWLYDVGLPGKSGIGGGIVTVAPGKGGLGTVSPLLDEVGNSVRGQLASRFLSRGLGLDLFASEVAAVRL
jgi:glutaminase